MEKTKPYMFEFIGRAVVGLILLFTLLGLPLAAYSATITLQWDPPSTNSDGSPLVDLAYYRLYYGYEPHHYNFHIDTNKSTASVSGLSASVNYYFAVTAINSNNVESDYSNEYVWNQVSPAPATILTSANEVIVPEGGTATFQVKLNTAPVNPTTVTVSWVSGDTDLAVQSSDSLVLNASTWNIDQTVTLSAAEDADTVNGSAIIRCSTAGTTDKNVTATEQDNDTAAINLALASRGSTITGDNGANWGVLIDGVTTGYDGDYGYGYTFWSPTPGTITLDLKGLCSITQTRLLLWDLDRRYYRYKIEASIDSTTWTPLVDRTTTNRCRGWQDIPFAPPVQARYLRLTGTYGNYNPQFHVVEWEVYGTPLASSAPAPAILTSANAVTALEGGTATFQVKLNTAPVNPTTVTVSWLSGDTDLAVQSSDSLVFNASTWNIDQTVTLSAAEDADTVNGSAIIRCSTAGTTNKDVTATEQDNDTAAINLALASRGSTITGDNGTNWGVLIDGITTGYDCEYGYGYTFWSPTPGAMTLDLKGLCLITCTKLLLWDLDNRYYRYKIEASIDSTTWTTIVDRTTTNLCRGWQDISFDSPVQARYLRLIGTYDSANVQFHAVEWEVYGTPNDAFVVNLALASRGSTITGDNGANWGVLIDGITTGYDGEYGYGYTFWSPTPGAMTLDLKGLYSVTRTKLLLWDLDDRYYRYKIEASIDSTTWTTIVDRTTTNLCRGWQDISFNSPVQARYLRLTGTYGSANVQFHAVEWEVYGTPNNAFVVNLALASRGSTITGDNGANWGVLIDGVTTGYDCEYGYGYTFWSPTPGAMTLDLKGLCLITCTKLLLWDLDNRYYRYKIEASIDSTTWTTIVDRTTTNLCRGWQDISFDSPVQARYLRLIGTYDSANVQFHAVEWEVYGTPNDAFVVNLALASRGSTITGDNGANWGVLIDGITTGYDGEYGYGYTFWSPTPGAMTLDLKGLYSVTRTKLLLWDLDDRYYRYKIEASIDSTTWTTLVDRTTTNLCRGWQDISFNSPVQARYLRLTGTYGSANVQFHAVEWEVYGVPVAPPASSDPASKGNLSVLEPIDVRTSDPEPDTNGWKAVDGNPATFWQGQADARGWWLVLAYGKEVTAQDVQVQWVEGSETNLLLFGSVDAEQWYDLAPLLKQGPVSFGYLWFVIPEGEAGITPKVSEIRVDSAE